MSARVIQTFVRACTDCKHCSYYSGGMYECTITNEHIQPDDRQASVGSRCPLPFAGPTFDALTEALVEAREQIAILQDRLGIKDNGHGTLSIIDAALASIKGGDVPARVTIEEISE